MERSALALVARRRRPVLPQRRADWQTDYAGKLRDELPPTEYVAPVDAMVARLP